VEKVGLLACSVGNSASRGRKRKPSDSDYAIGGIGPCPTNAVVAGAWVKPSRADGDEYGLSEIGAPEDLGS
jgi:hypothetical protein